MAESDALSYWPVTIVPESKLSHMATVHYGFVPKLSHHGGKTEKTEQKPNLLLHSLTLYRDASAVFKVFVNNRYLN